MAKLSDREEENLVSDWKTGRYSQRDLADKYNCSKGKVIQLTQGVEKAQNNNTHKEFNPKEFIEKYGLDNCILHFAIEDIKKEALLINDIVEDMDKSFRLIIRKKIELEDFKLFYVLYDMNISESELLSIINVTDNVNIKSSHTSGEQKIKDFLERKKIKHTSEYTFKKLPKKRFDFYIESKNMCIEFDGKQHFEAIDFFGGKESFEKTQKSDKEKNDFCHNNKIKLIRIPYFDFDKIDEILLLGLK